jgi:hypothetical protein
MADYIRREDALNILMRTDSIYGAYVGISNLEPLSAAKPKNGRWETAYLDHEAFGVRPHTFYCSECHQITSFRTFFCPNCGADMRGEDDV